MILFINDNFFNTFILIILDSYKIITSHLKNYLCMHNQIKQLTY